VKRGMRKEAVGMRGKSEIDVEEEEVCLFEVEGDYWIGLLHWSCTGNNVGMENHLVSLN
jgi:hypothetical protein